MNVSDTIIIFLPPTVGLVILFVGIVCVIKEWRVARDIRSKKALTPLKFSAAQAAQAAANMAQLTTTSKKAIKNLLRAMRKCARVKNKT